MPRIFMFRVMVLFLLFILTCTYWLFYGTRVLTNTTDSTSYTVVVKFASSMVDSLLFMHYAAVILIELRHLQTTYTVKMIRSPDGESHTYSIGQLSIQRAAVECLEHYYKDFNVYNPYLEAAIYKRSAKAGNNPNSNNFTVYNIDGEGDNVESVDQRSRAIITAVARKRDVGHNERYYEEIDYERKVARRKARLITAAEESFSHIKPLNEDSGPEIPMDSTEAADAIFPSMSRALQKFLRITRQQPWYPAELIISHLSNSLKFGISPRAFLEEFLTPGKIINLTKSYGSTEYWTLVSEQYLSRGIEPGTQFTIKKGAVTILCLVRKEPYFIVSEEVVNADDRKFTLRLSSETSV